MNDLPVAGEITYFGVIGADVQRSLSPAVHNAAFAAAGLPGRFLAISTDDPVALVREAREKGWGGLAVTMPHKQAVLPLADHLDPAVRAIGALNTLLFRGDQVLGFNTDVTGILKAFAEQGAILSGKTWLIVGAGGAARAALAAGLQAEARRIVIVNRHFAGAVDLAATFARHTEVLIEAADAAEPRGVAAMREAAIVVQATPVGGGPWRDQTPVDPDCLADDVCLLDVVYREGETRLMKAVRSKGGVAIGGDRMLLHQAAAQFELWTGRPAPFPVMEQALSEARS